MLARGVDVAVGALVAVAVAVAAPPLAPFAIVVISSVSFYRVVPFVAVSLLDVPPLLVFRTGRFGRGVRALAMAPANINETVSLQPRTCCTAH